MSWSWWPENGDGVEHEGWIQQIFNDGEEGTGSTNHAGVILAAQYDQVGNLVSQRIRPFHEVDRLRMVCSCGWRGITVALADMQGNLVDWDHREPTEAGEVRFLEEWRAHLEPLKARDSRTCPTCGHVAPAGASDE